MMPVFNASGSVSVSLSLCTHLCAPQASWLHVTWLKYLCPRPGRRRWWGTCAPFSCQMEDGVCKSLSHFFVLFTHALSLICIYLNYVTFLVFLTETGKGSRQTLCRLSFRGKATIKSWKMSFDTFASIVLSSYFWKTQKTYGTSIYICVTVIKLPQKHCNSVFIHPTAKKTFTGEMPKMIQCQSLYRSMQQSECAFCFSADILKISRPSLEQHWVTSHKGSLE